MTLIWHESLWYAHARESRVCIDWVHGWCACDTVHDAIYKNVPIVCFQKRKHDVIKNKADRDWVHVRLL